MDRFGDLQFLGRLDNRGYVVARDPGPFVPGIGRLKADLIHPVLLKWASDLPCSLQNFDVVVEVRNGPAHCNRLATRHLKVYPPLFDNDSGLRARSFQVLQEPSNPKPPLTAVPPPKPSAVIRSFAKKNALRLGIERNPDFDYTLERYRVVRPQSHRDSGIVSL